MIIFRYIQSNVKSSKLYQINNNLPSWLHDKPKKYLKHCDEKLKLANEILKDQIITSENKKFAVKSATIKDVKDTHREKAPSNETPALTKSTNISIRVVGTTNQLFIRGS